MTVAGNVLLLARGAQGSTVATALRGGAAWCFVPWSCSTHHRTRLPVRPLRAHISTHKGLAPQKAKDILKKAQAVCFDVDSTVCAEEGIDVLAEFLGQGQAVADLTAKAMGGTVLFQDALQGRLDLIKPSRAHFADCIAKHPATLSNGVKQFIDILHKRGTAVYLVSGGFRLMIEPVADRLSIPHHRIYANTVLFKEDGTYKGFDPQEPTSRDGGKPAVVKSLKERFGYVDVVMIGDGATDMQARPPADAFVGYGGVTVRENVAKGADWFVYNFQELIDVVKS
ncbi:phosphoserine phosphatase [Nannochloropsis oceanica]